jgi:hypothetical protein
MDEMCSLHNVMGHKLEMKRQISIFNDFLSLIKLIVLFFRI